MKKVAIPQIKHETPIRVNGPLPETTASKHVQKNTAERPDVTLWCRVTLVVQILVDDLCKAD